MLTHALSAGYYDAYYGKALKVRRLIADDFARAYQDVDILLTPTAPTVAFPFGTKYRQPARHVPLRRVHDPLAAGRPPRHQRPLRRRSGRAACRRAGSRPRSASPSCTAPRRCWSRS